MRIAKWTAIGCGCLSTLVLVVFGILVAMEMNGVGLSKLSAAPVSKPSGLVTPASPPPVSAVPTGTTAAAAVPTPLAKPGQGVILTTPAGMRLVVTVNGVTDPAQSTNQANKAQGRWVLLDWSVRNEGQSDFQPNETWLKLVTEGNFVITRGNFVGHQPPEFERSILGPGQTRRGFLVYDVPAGQRLRTAVFQSPDTRQFVIADLSQ